MSALTGIKIVSLALNLPGPAALMRCRGMGATCIKVEPPAGDPMAWYNRSAYAQLHEGVQVLEADMKTEAGRRTVHEQLADANVLLTSFRPSGLARLGLEWEAIHARYPKLSQVAIVGGPGAAAEIPGHDLTYLAENGLVPGTELPATLYADMSGSLMASEAVLQAALAREGTYFEVPLADAAAYIALPRRWGMTLASGPVGGAHAGYRVYPCKDGRAAIAALEPHFAAGICAAAGVAGADIFAKTTRDALAAFFAQRTCAELTRLAREQDLPIYTMQD